MRINKAGIEGSEICKRNKVTVINFEPILGIMDFDLPEWLLIEVLIRLPVKIIFRKKLVCKNWLCVISDPSFVRMYISRASLLQPLQPWVFVSRSMCFHCVKHLDYLQYEVVENMYSRKLKCPSYYLLHLPSTQEPQRENFIVHGISNGLVLYNQIVANSDGTFMETEIYNICNPVTGQWISLPPQTCQFKVVHRGFLAQVEDGMLKSYRVVCLDWSFQRTNTTRFGVFFSESGEWKDFRVSSNLEVEIFWARPPTDLHGNLHWVLCKNGILAYDPYQKPDDLRIIPLPRDKDQEYNQPRGSGTSSLCGVSDGKLRYFEISGFDTPHGVSLEIWILNDYSSGDWSLQNRISRSDILCDVTLSCLTTSILPISFDPFDSDIVYLGYMNIIVSFNIKTKRLEAHCQPGFNSPFLEHEPYFRLCQATCWLALMLFFIPPWPTSIPPPSFKSIEK